MQISVHYSSINCFHSLFSVYYHRFLSSFSLVAAMYVFFFYKFHFQGNYFRNEYLDTEYLNQFEYTITYATKRRSAMDFEMI